MPIYDNQRKNDVAEELALLQELLHLAVNNDTNLVLRGCIEGLESARVQAKSLLLEGGTRAIDGILKLNALHDALIVHNLSPRVAAPICSRSPGSLAGSTNREPTVEAAGSADKGTRAKSFRARPSHRH